MGVAMNIDGVFDLDVRRMNRAGFVLCARSVGSDAAFVSRRGNIMSAHRFGLLGLAVGDVATIRADLSKHLE
jgi:hypothetical protein